MSEPGPSPSEEGGWRDTCDTESPSLRCYFTWFERVPPPVRRGVKLAIPFLALLAMLLLPLAVALEVKATLAVFVCVALLWTLEPVPLAVTALLVPVLLVSLGVATPAQSLEPFADPIVYLLMGGLIIAEAFHINGLDRRLAFYLVARMGGDVRKALLAMMLVTALLSMWMSNTAAIALLLPVAVGVASKVVGDRPRVLAAFLLGMGMAGLFGGMATITGS
ncbi:MAG: SLC13 family permease, partial [Methanomassiliicoccales archaeon]|nr:SLC13 family permease [Methanomassiliicoccales archaeon]